MNIGYLTQDIKDKELRLSQLRNMDIHKLSGRDLALIKEPEEQISLLKEKLNEE